jgi:hypothetical protein
MLTATIATVDAALANRPGSFYRVDSMADPAYLLGAGSEDLGSCPSWVSVPPQYRARGKLLSYQLVAELVSWW